MNRSKSVASNYSSSDLLVGTEAKSRSNLRRLPAVEMRDSSTQTVADAGTQARLSEDAEIAAIAENADISELEEEMEETLAQSQWLDHQIRVQGELEMALRSGMELIAERVYSQTPPPPMPQPASLPKPPVGTRRPGPRHPDSWRSPDPEHLSDGECHREDDEVRSLSLSEDGPMFLRSFSEGSRRAPDAIAMFSDGQNKLPDHSDPLPLWRTTSESGHVSDLSAPNGSDESGARTRDAGEDVMKKVRLSLTSMQLRSLVM